MYFSPILNTLSVGDCTQRRPVAEGPYLAPGWLQPFGGPAELEPVSLAQARRHDQGACMPVLGAVMPIGVPAGR